MTFFRTFQQLGDAFILKVKSNILKQVTLVSFQPDHVICIAIDYFGHDNLLATHRIRRNYAPLNVKHVQKFRYGCYFIRFLIYLDLSQRYLVFCNPRADNMICLMFCVTASTYRLAVDIDHRPRIAFFVEPAEEAF
jgi:hypothetical protein